MPDDVLLYEEWASEALSFAKRSLADAKVWPEAADWGDAYEEMTSELVSLANLVGA